MSKCTTCGRPFGDPACASTEHKRIEWEIEQRWRNPDGSGKRGMYSSTRSSRKNAALSGRDRDEPYQNVLPAPAGSRMCVQCEETKPNRRFWDRKRGVLRQKCSACLIQNRSRSTFTKTRRGEQLRKQGEADRYWEAQSATHS